MRGGCVKLHAFEVERVNVLHSVLVANAHTYMRMRFRNVRTYGIHHIYNRSSEARPPPNHLGLDFHILYYVYVTGFGKTGLIAGLVKLIFFLQKMHLLSSSTAYAKYENFTYLCFHAMTLNSRPFAIIAFLMFEENAFRVCC